MARKRSASASHSRSSAGRERSIVFHGGLFRSEWFTEHAVSAVRAHAPGFRVRPPVADPVAGALRLAGALLGT